MTSTHSIKSVTTPTSIHTFKVESLDGGIIDFAQFKGKKILIVNTASECGFTPQYDGLQKLYDQYKEKLVIVGFPANNFGAQEPGSNDDIKTFCKKTMALLSQWQQKFLSKEMTKHPFINGYAINPKMV
jgi:glutathione peroxidase